MEGEVTSTERGPSGRDIVNVRLSVPELLMDPTGRIRVVVLPYAPAELEVLA